MFKQPEMYYQLHDKTKEIVVDSNEVKALPEEVKRDMATSLLEYRRKFVPLMNIHTFEKILKDLGLYNYVNWEG